MDEIASRPSLDDLDELRALAAAHHVTSEVYPEQRVRSGELEQVGFAVELLGTHDRPKQTPEPGCAECLRVHRVLRRIAEYVIPRQNRPTLVEIDAYEPSLHFDGSASSAPRVRLTMRLVHRVAFGGGVDECERICLDEITRGLRDLGIPRTRG